jgi:hypothetical protein
LIKRIISAIILSAVFLVCYAPLTYAEDIAKDKYAIISNESTNITSTQSTGNYYCENSLDSEEILTDKNAYKMDYMKPFNKNIALEENTISNSKLDFQLYTVNYVVGDTKIFWTWNIDNNYYEQIYATLKAVGVNANVWVKNLESVSTSDASKIATEFDTKIFSQISSAFGQPSDVDHNGKINILCFDIQDGFNGSGGYVAGYFDPNDLYAYHPYYNPCTNDMEVFYIDTYPAMGTGSTKDVTECYDTLAHEFQHMVNWNQNIFIENNDYMDTWLDEALSEAASQVYSGQVSQSRISWYNSSSTITTGRSLLRWDQHLDNYALSYLFAEYLKEQVGIGNGVFLEVTQSIYNDYRSVEQVVKKYIDPNLTFGQFMTNFRTALLLKNPTGPYGFKGNAGFNTIQQKIYSGSAVNLYGGGAIVVAANATTNKMNIPTNKGQDVQYFIITDLPRGVQNNVNYNTNRTIYYFYGTATLNGNKFVSGTMVSAEGNYILEITKVDNTKTNTNFIIDKAAPLVSGVVNNNVYINKVVITFNEGNAKLNGTDFMSGNSVSNSGNYTLTVTDLAGNTTEIVFSIEAVAKGDVNEDGKIAAVDALMALQAASGRIILTDTQQYAADVNNDGKITTIDALKILQFISGRIGTFN